MTTIKIKRLPHAYQEIVAVSKQPLNSIELVAALPERETIVIAPGDRAAIPTGLALELPPLWEAQILSLSSLAAERGISVLNSPGTIDPDYRGEVIVILINLGSTQAIITRGTPIALIKFAKFERVILVASETISESKRGKSGLGSTGTN